ncbi:hypothetical protein A1D25_02020 [Ursidibacter arcticus]|uniref:protein NO VEIN domain-containing protein n=1 Tax=Ursidibacter arcticus TaxID=1524965 RepID=UPI0012F8B871|nr:DUF3883 domain-containing protein [Ursidibacter arcticus]KAE9531137.1 hypothetical protein A1D25_02020 [Ursidibacter arcticus]
MFNPDIQYRCTIIRGKAQKELDNLLPAYASMIAEICPCLKHDFDKIFNDRLSNVIYGKDFLSLNEAHKKTIRNHITEIAGKLFGLYFEKDGLVYEGHSNAKLLEDNDQPAFFKNLCLNFQFPNGTQKIQTIIDRLKNKIKFKPFHFIISLLDLAQTENIKLTKDEIGYYVLNAQEVLQGEITTRTVLNVIKIDRNNGIIKRLGNGSRHTQHIREQLNLLELANLIIMDNNYILLNNNERSVIKLFIEELDKPLSFDIYSYDLGNEYQKLKMYSDWSEYFSQIAVKNPEILATTLFYQESQQKNADKKISTTALGDQGEEFIFNLEKERVAKTHPRLVNKIQLVGKQRGLGYDILSVDAAENKEDPEFARFIEVKSTTRITEPDLKDLSWLDTVNLTRKEWIAAKQYRDAYNIYRVYFTLGKVVVRKINNPFDKNEKNIIQVIPTMYRMDFNSAGIDLEY